GELIGKKVIQGGSESIFQPQWSPDGRLYFISDRTDFWNLYRWSAAVVEHVLARDAEFGGAQWNLGLSTYAFLSQDVLIYSFVQDGTWRLGLLEVPTLIARDFPTVFSSLSGVRALANTIVVRYATTASPSAIATVDPSSGAVTPIKFSVPPGSVQVFQ